MGRAERTRGRIEEAALDLFARQGFEATTVEQVAAAAGVSHMTFFRHFPTKQSVLLDDPFDPVLAQAVVAAPRELTPVSRICTGLRAALQHLDLPAQEQVRVRMRIALDTPSLAGSMWSNTLTTQRVITEALADDGAPRHESGVAAAAVLAALTVALQQWALADPDDPDAPTMAQTLTHALDVVENRSAP